MTQCRHLPHQRESGPTPPTPTLGIPPINTLSEYKQLKDAPHPTNQISQPNHIIPAQMSLPKPSGISPRSSAALRQIGDKLSQCGVEASLEHRPIGFNWP